MSFIQRLGYNTLTLLKKGGLVAPEDTDNKQDPVLVPAVSPASGKTPAFTPRRHRLLKWLVIAVVVLILGLGGLFGWLAMRDRNGTEEEKPPTAASSNEQESAEEAPVCDENFKIYTNQDLDIQFCYPIAWGEVSASDAKFAVEDEGQRWRLSFSEKPQVNAGLVSEDWSTSAARELTCVDPAVQELPPFSPFSTDWDVEIETDTVPPEPSSAIRGIEKEDDILLIQERVDDLLTNGACLSGYEVTSGDIYPFVTATYYAEFNDEVAAPAQHINDPNKLITAIDRADFAVFVKSIHLIET